MAAVHFTTIPFEPNIVDRHIASHIFREIRLRTNNIVLTTTLIRSFTDPA